MSNEARLQRLTAKQAGPAPISEIFQAGSDRLGRPSHAAITGGRTGDGDGGRRHAARGRRGAMSLPGYAVLCGKGIQIRGNTRTVKRQYAAKEMTSVRVLPGIAGYCRVMGAGDFFQGSVVVLPGCNHNMWGCSDCVASCTRSHASRSSRGVPEYAGLCRIVPVRGMPRAAPEECALHKTHGDAAFDASRWYFTRIPKNTYARV